MTPLVAGLVAASLLLMSVSVAALVVAAILVSIKEMQRKHPNAVPSKASPATGRNAQGSFGGFPTSRKR